MRFSFRGICYSEYFSLREKINFLFLCATGVFIISPFLLSIYIGNGLIPRMQFNYQFVIATVLYLIIWMLKDKKS